MIPEAPPIHGYQLSFLDWNDTETAEERNTGTFETLCPLMYGQTVEKLECRFYERVLYPGMLEKGTYYVELQGEGWKVTWRNSAFDEVLANEGLQMSSLLEGCKCPNGSSCQRCRRAGFILRKLARATKAPDCSLRQCEALYHHIPLDEEALEESQLLMRLASMMKDEPQ